jgi:hypothetical protein
VNARNDGRALEPFGLFGAKVCLARRFFGGLLGVHLRVRAEASCSRFGEQRAYGALLGGIFALAEVRDANAASGVDEVLGGPVFVVVRVPGVVVVVLYDRIADTVLADRLGDVGRGVLEGELGRMDADDREALARVLGVPGVQIGKRANAVDAAVGPEVD